MLQTSLAFFSVALLLALVLGPGNVFVLMQSATGGRRAGFAVISGLMLGVLVHTLAVALQMVWFGLLFIAAATLVFGAVAIAADALRDRLARSARAQRWLNRAAALVFVGLAARLVLAER